RIKLAGGTGLFDQRLRVRAFGLLDDQRKDDVVNIEFPGRDQGARRLASGRFSADYKVMDALELQFRLFQAHDDYNGPHIEGYKAPPNAALAPPGSYSDDPYKTRNNDRGFTKNKLDLGSIKAVYQLTPTWSITSLTGDSKFSKNPITRSDGDGTDKGLISSLR